MQHPILLVLVPFSLLLHPLKIPWGVGLQAHRTQWLSHPGAGMDSRFSLDSLGFPTGLTQLAVLHHCQGQRYPLLCGFTHRNNTAQREECWILWQILAIRGLAGAKFCLLEAKATVLVLEYLVQHLVLVKLYRVFKEQIYREDTAFFMQFLPYGNTA